MQGHSCRRNALMFVEAEISETKMVFDTMTSLTFISKDCMIEWHKKNDCTTGLCPESFKSSGEVEYNNKIGKSETIIPAIVI